MRLVLIGRGLRRLSSTRGWGAVNSPEVLDFLGAYDAATMTFDPYEIDCSPSVGDSVDEMLPFPVAPQNEMDSVRRSFVAPRNAKWISHCWRVVGRDADFMPLEGRLQDVSYPATGLLVIPPIVQDLAATGRKTLGDLTLQRPRAARRGWAMYTSRPSTPSVTTTLRRSSPGCACIRTSTPSLARAPTPFPTAAQPVVREDVAPYEPPAGAPLRPMLPHTQMQVEFEFAEDDLRQFLALPNGTLQASRPLASAMTIPPLGLLRFITITANTVPCSGAQD